MFDAIAWLFDTRGFVPRGSCGDWSPAWQALAITVDLVYGISDLAIPVFLVALWRLKRAVYGRAGYTLLLFAGVMAGGGLSHAGQVLVWWWPAYRLFIALSLPGAVLSISCACLLPAVWWHFCRLPTPRQLLDLNDSLAATVAQRDRLIEDLRLREQTQAQQLERLERMRRNGVWTDEQQRLLNGLAESMRNG